jgi:hypothetical protein
MRGRARRGKCARFPWQCLSRNVASLHFTAFGPPYSDELWEGRSRSGIDSRAEAVRQWTEGKVSWKIYIDAVGKVLLADVCGETGEKERWLRAVHVRHRMT